MEQYCKSCGMPFDKEFFETGNCPLCGTLHDLGDEFVGVPGGLPDSRPLTPQERKEVAAVVAQHFRKKSKKPKK